MIGNYIKMAFRIMMRQKGYSAINLAGLSIGIATSLLIFLYIADELSFDRFHKDADRIYRIGFGGKLQGSDFASANTPVPLAEGLRTEVPGIERTVRFGIWRNTPMSLGEKRFTLYKPATGQRDQHSKSNGCVCFTDHEAFIQGPHGTGIHCLFHRDPAGYLRDV